MYMKHIGMKNVCCKSINERIECAKRCRIEGNSEQIRNAIGIYCFVVFVELSGVCLKLDNISEQCLLELRLDLDKCYLDLSLLSKQVLWFNSTYCLTI